MSERQELQITDAEWEVMQSVWEADDQTPALSLAYNPCVSEAIEPFELCWLDWSIRLPSGGESAAKLGGIQRTRTSS